MEQIERKTGRPLSLRNLERRIGYTFKNRALLTLAFTPMRVDNRAAGNYRRLELLGDAFFDLITLSLLFLDSPDASTKDLANLKAWFVSNSTLRQISRRFELRRYLIGSTGDLPQSGKPKADADLIESLIGAVLVDGGAKAAIKLIGRLFELDVDPTLAMFKGPGVAISLLGRLGNGVRDIWFLSKPIAGRVAPELIKKPNRPAKLFVSNAETLQARHDLLAQLLEAKKLRLRYFPKVSKRSRSHHRKQGVLCEIKRPTGFHAFWSARGTDHDQARKNVMRQAERASQKQWANVLEQIGIECPSGSP